MKIFAVIGLLFVSSNAFAWSATFLGGSNWAITCANGTSWSYNGSSAGLDTVGPALCPGGIAQPNGPTGTNVVAGISPRVKINILKNRHETTEKRIPAARTYPPNGYPCLGCKPCPDKSGDFCDIETKNRVIISARKATGRVTFDL